jgi:O-antigen/teichoic acid export membrane protein
VKDNLKRVLWVASGDAGARLIGFVVTAYLARVLGPSGFGLVNVGLAVLAYMSQISGAGLQVLETRNTAVGGARDDGRVGSVVGFRLILAGILTCLTGVVVTLFVQDGGTGEVIWLSSIILIPLALSLDWFYQGRERFGLLGVSRLLTACAYGALVFVFVHGPADYGAAVLSLAGGTLAGALLLLGLFVRERGTPALSMRSSHWKDIAWKSMLIGLALFAGQSAVNLGPIVLGLWFGSADAGMFSAGMKIVLVVLLLDRVLNSILLPLISRVGKSRPEEFSGLVTLVFKGVFALIFPVAVCCGVLAPWLVSIVFGEGYLGAVDHFRCLLVYVIFTMLNSVLMCSMLAVGEEVLYSQLLLIGSTILAVLVVLFTVMFGPVGAGLGVGLGELVMFIILLRAGRRVLMINLHSTVLRSFVAAIATLGVVTILPPFSPVGVAAVSVGVFVLALILAGAMSLHECRTLLEKIL